MDVSFIHISRSLVIYNWTHGVGVTWWLRRCIRKLFEFDLGRDKMNLLAQDRIKDDWNQNKTITFRYICIYY